MQHIHGAVCNNHIFPQGSNITEEDSNRMEDIFRRVGIIEEVEEAHVNAVTGLGGSGPAYVSVVLGTKCRQKHDLDRGL